MKKILIVFHCNETYSGATASMLTLLEKFKERKDFQIEALIPNEEGDLNKKLESMEIPYQKALYYPLRYAVNGNKCIVLLRYLKAIVKFFINAVSLFLFMWKNRDKKYNLIYSNTSSIYFGFFYALLSRIDHIWHFREFGIEDQNCNHICGEYLFYNISYKFSKEVIVISESLYRKVYSFIKDDDKLHVVYNDIDKGHISFNQKKFDINSNKTLKILITGTITEKKGQDIVINALDILKDKGIFFELGMAGNGNKKYIDYLNKKIIALDLQNYIKILGFRSDMDNIRSEFDIAIIASTSEAFGRVTVEAMLSGLLVIGSNSGANLELIKNKLTGFIFNSEDANSLAIILEHIYYNRSNLENITINAYQYALGFTQGVAANKILSILISDLYEELI